jgi:chorismate mutase
MTADQTLAMLQEQLDCYKRLAKLAGTQHEHVQNSRTEELLTVLTQRQEVIDQLARLEEIIAPVKKEWNDYLGTLPADDRDRAAKVMEESRRLLEQITNNDKDDAMVLQQRKFRLGREINQASSARQFNRSYAAAAYARPKTAVDVQR